MRTSKNFARASNYVSQVKRLQFRYFSINERINFVSTKKFIATLFLAKKTEWQIVKLRFFATAFEVYSGNSVIVNSSCLIIAII